MKTAAVPHPLYAPLTPKPQFLDAVAKRAVRGRLAGLKHGVLTLADATRRFSFCVSTSPRSGSSC